MSAPRKFVFIAGAEGSGTTLLLRLVSAPAMCSSLGGNYKKLPDTPEAGELADEFEAANRLAWDRTTSFIEYGRARQRWHAAIVRVMESSAFAGQTHLAFKRSFPFATPREQHTPDLWDVVDLLPGVRLLVIYRDPRAATFSALRRGFDTDLRRLAVVCSEQLTRLAAQVEAIGAERFLILNYEGLCANPGAVLSQAAVFCELPQDAMQEAATAEPFDTAANSRFWHELSTEDIAWLDGFFDERRRRQWAILASGDASGDLQSFRS